MPLSCDPAAPPRGPLLYLQVEAAPCPQALLRVLGLIVQQGHTPRTILANQDADGLFARIGLEMSEGWAAELLLHKIAALVNVQAARYLQKRDSPAVCAGSQAATGARPD